MLIEGLFTAMTNCTALTDIVSARVYQTVLPKNPKVPAVTYLSIGAKQGDICLDSSFATVEMVEFNVWANTYHDAAYGKAALHALLDLYVGTLPDGTVVLMTTANDNPDFYEQDSLLYRCGVTFTFTHS